MVEYAVILLRSISGNFWKSSRKATISAWSNSKGFFPWLCCLFPLARTSFPSINTQPTGNSPSLNAKRACLMAWRIFFSYVSIICVFIRKEMRVYSFFLPMGSLGATIIIVFVCISNSVKRKGFSKFQF